MGDHHEAIWSSRVGDGPVVAVAVHHGHDLRPEVGEIMALDDDTRLREEDPFTGRLTDMAPTRFVVHRSRFEMDLNRHRDNAVYLTPEEAWGLEVWREPPGPALLTRSRTQHDAFYEALLGVLGAIQQRWGRFVLLDLHSYNHRRDGEGAEAAFPADNPVVNIGTGSMDRQLWAPVVDAFSSALSSTEVNGETLDVRENIRFQGGYLSRWVHETFPGTGCAMAIEIKKIFMNEWTGVLDEGVFEEIRASLTAAIEPTAAALDTVQSPIRHCGRGNHEM